MAHCVHDNMHTTHTEIEMHTFHANVRFRRHGNISFGIKKGKKTLKMKWQLVFFRLLKVVERRTKKKKKTRGRSKDKKAKRGRAKDKKGKEFQEDQEKKSHFLFFFCVFEFQSQL